MTMSSPPYRQLFLYDEQSSDTNDSVDDSNEVYRFLTSNNVEQTYRELTDPKNKLYRGYTLLHYAVYYANVRAVRFLVLSEKVDVNALSENNIPPLFLACIRNEKDIATFLIANGAKVDYSDNEGRTILHYCAHFNATKCFDILLDHVNVDVLDHYMQSPLHIACRNGSLEMTVLLLAYTNAIDQPDFAGRTPLHLAASSGHTQCVEKLIENNANVSACDKKQQTPLDLAALNGYSQCICLLLSSDVNAISRSSRAVHFACMANDNQYSLRTLMEKCSIDDLMDEKGYTVLHYLCLANERCSLEYLNIVRDNLSNDVLNDLIESTPSNGFSCLHLAASLDRPVLVQEFLKLGANVDVKDENGFAPVHYAVACGSIEVLTKLMEFNADFNSRSSRGTSCSHLAAIHMKPEVAEWLVELNLYDVECLDKLGRLPFHYAAMKGCMDVVKKTGLPRNVNAQDNCGLAPIHFLASHSNAKPWLQLFRGTDLNIDIVDEKGRTALHYSADNMSNTSFVDFAASFNADFTLKDVYGSTCMHFSAEKGHLKHLKKVLNHWPDSVLPIENNGKTPLHYAAEKGHVKCLHALLDKFPFPDCLDNDGLTPLHWAIINRHQMCTSLLIERGASLEVVNRFNLNVVQLAVFKTNEKFFNLVYNTPLFEKSLKTVDIIGRNLLHLACEKRSPKFIQLLIDQGISVNDVDHEGRTALIYTVAANSPANAEILLNAGADPYIRDKRGLTPFHYCAANDRFELFTKLISCVGTMDPQRLHPSVDEKTYTPLEWAIKSKNARMCNLILNSGGDYIRTSKGYKFLSLSGYNKSEMQDKLQKEIAAGCSSSPMHLGAMFAFPEIIILSAIFKISVDCRDHRNRTPLLISSLCNRRDMFNFLLQMHADITAVDSDGNNALHNSCNTNAVGISLDILNHANASTLVFALNAKKQAPIDIAGSNCLSPVVSGISYLMNEAFRIPKCGDLSGSYFSDDDDIDMVAESGDVSMDTTA